MALVEMEQLERLERLTQGGSVNSGAGRPLIHSCQQPLVLEGARRGVISIVNTSAHVHSDFIYF